MSVLRHKDYQGEVEYDEGRLIVRVLHIEDLITTEIDSASEAQAAFAELVEDYVASCVELGKQPSKPFKGSFNIRMSPDLHKQLAFAAIEDGETLNSFVVSIIENNIHAGRHETANTTVSSTIGPGASPLGSLRFSLVTCPIIAIPAISESRITFDQINRDLASQVLYLQDQADPDSEARSPWIIEIDQFVPKNEVDKLYLTSPYYIVPNGRIGQHAYAVIREAIRSLDKVAIARVVVAGHERIIALEARANGLLGTMVRHPYEVRDSSEYFDEIEDVKVTKDMLDLAKLIVDRKSGRFDPETFWDHDKTSANNSDKSHEGLPKEIDGLPNNRSNVINLMDALRASLSYSNRTRTEKKPQRAASTKPARKS
jgi:DNA end-binding protein Ku